jgi:hypothetical protein
MCDFLFYGELRDHALCNNCYKMCSCTCTLPTFYTSVIIFEICITLNITNVHKWYMKVNMVIMWGCDIYSHVSNKRREKLRIQRGL